MVENSCDGFSDHKKSPPPQQHKKQVRRRLHTSRPYQERLLNMAEARREIVTALKFHRAAMKQATEKQQQQQQIESGYGIQPLESSHQISPEQKSRRNTIIYASGSSNPNFSASSLDNFSYSPNFCSPYSWPVSPIGPLPPPPPPYFQENLNFPLPSQTLGLNLNLEDFTYLETSNFQYSSNSSSIYSSSSFTNTSSSYVSAVVEPTAAVEFDDSGLHPVMDDKELAEIRSIGELYQVEWDDTMNLMTSACWFKYLKAMEIGPEDQKADDCVNSPFDEVMEFPAWLSANESLLDDHCSDCCLQDPSLPCMDIEEIEGMDGDWLA